MLGLHFDPSLPLIAASAFNAGDTRVEAGDHFDWRARGLTELEALAMFSAGLLTAAPVTAAATAAQPAKSKQPPQRGR